MKKILLVGMVILLSQSAFANDTDDQIAEDLNAVSQLEVTLKAKEGAVVVAKRAPAAADDDMVVVLKSAKRK